MYKEFYAGSELMNWPLIGLGIFILTFIGVLLYVFVGLKDSPSIDRLAAMPLDDDAAEDTMSEVEDRV